MIQSQRPAAALFNFPVQRSTSFTSPIVELTDDSSDIPSDLRRATSLRTSGSFGGGGGPGPSSSTSRILDSQRVIGLSSFAAAGSTLSSSNYTPPPAASRHPLFSHHAVISSGTSSPTIFTDPGPSYPPSPTGSSGSAMSPASAFLSHFSSSSSLRPPGPGPTTSSGGGVERIEPDAIGARVLDYTLGKIVGRGGFSSVRKAHHIVTGEVLACKIVKRDDLSDRSGSVEKFEEEIRIWKSLPRHPSLLPLLEMTRTPTMTFLITPYLPGGSLLDVLRREGGSEKTAGKWFPGVVTAVSVMHEGFQGLQGEMLHGDLKLDNFLVDHHGHVMVCDFYMAQQLTSSQDDMSNHSHVIDGDIPKAPSKRSIPQQVPSLADAGFSVPPPMPTRHSTLPSIRGPRKSSPFPTTKSHGLPRDPSPLSLSNISSNPFPSASLPYAPPELLRAPPSGPALAQDIWALGIILHALLTGRLPFVDSFDPRLQMKILRGTWEIPPDLGKEWIECLQGCLDVNRDTRWTIAQVRACDALLGWHEVKRHGGRSKSRSRSRRRDGDLFDSGRHGDLSRTTQPIPIKSRGVSRDRSGRFPGVGEMKDVFGPGPNSNSYPGGVGGGLTYGSGINTNFSSQSTSKSRGRSQSTTRRNAPIAIDIPPRPPTEITHDLGHGVETQRGRSPLIKEDHGSVSPVSVLGLHHHDISRQRSHSQSSGKQDRQISESFNMDSTPWSTSPIMEGQISGQNTRGSSVGSRSRSRSRRWESGMTTPEKEKREGRGQHVHGSELDVVEEERVARGISGGLGNKNGYEEERKSNGRSRSRGRREKRDG
ncbi:CAMK protein kinase [Tremella mesenterica]|uniref:CAMK protein kinase n=1 Tax=Tremella mesenterica TaxID=5217 RepID=A0A4Q1BE15_TREME|nr:CAMK protein kinase [Tremella mesenterica]